VVVGTDLGTVVVPVEGTVGALVRAPVGVTIVLVLVGVVMRDLLGEFSLVRTSKKNSGRTYKIAEEDKNGVGTVQKSSKQ